MNDKQFLEKITVAQEQEIATLKEKIRLLKYIIWLESFDEKF